MQTPMKTLARRLFKKNRGRNLVAALAIVLTTLMFTVLFVLSQSMSQNMVEMSFRQSGYDTHASFKEITDAQIEAIAAHPDTKSIGRSIVVGVADNAALTGRQLEIRYADEAYARHSFALPTTGRLPDSADEVALDTLVLSRLGIQPALGQTVTLEWTRDYGSGEVLQSSFTLVGIWEANTSSYASMAWVGEPFALEACGYAEGPTGNSVTGLRMAQLMLRSDRNMEQTVEGILADVGYPELEYSINLAYDSVTKANALMETLPMYLGMLLVFAAGYLIIYNIFQISVTSDIQFYGQLKTLGTTKKQLKKLIYSQANRLCLLGIPVGLVLGFLLGYLLVPVLVSGLDTAPSVSFSPVIFIGSALFAWATVLISCLRPARIAGKVSPMEALRYTDGDGGLKKKSKKSRKGASVTGMAVGNLGRNKKRTGLVVCSLTLSLVLLSSFYAKDASFDIEQYLSDLILSDFQVDDATNGDYMNGYNPASGTISPALLESVAALDGLEATGTLRSEELVIPLTGASQQNIQAFYERNNRLSYMEYDPYWMEGYHTAMAAGEVSGVVYGADGIALETIASPGFIMAGAYDAERFASGEYIIAMGVASDDYSEQMPTFSVGDTVAVGSKEYTVMAITDPVQPIVSGGGQSSFYLNFVLPMEEFRQNWPDNGIRKLFFNVDDAGIAAAETMLLDYQQEVDGTLSYASRQTMAEQYERQTRSAAVMGNAISVVIALVGVLNFVNSMVTAILSRKREFAMIQSVGMTTGQLRRMLVEEGLGYALLTLVASYLLSAAALLLVIRPMVATGFTTFQFTLLPLVLCTPVLLALAVAIPYLCFKNIEKQSIVERLRTE